MSNLKLNFLDDNYSKNQITYVDLLEKYGKEISDYASGYFAHLVTSTAIDEEVKDVTLYIVAPELPYEYRILNIEILNIKMIKITLFSLTNSPIGTNMDITGGLVTVDNKIKEYLGTNHANESLRLLASKVNLKRKSESKAE